MTDRIHFLNANAAPDELLPFADDRRVITMNDALALAEIDPTTAVRLDAYWAATELGVHSLRGICFIDWDDIEHYTADAKSVGRYLGFLCEQYRWIFPLHASRALQNAGLLGRPPWDPANYPEVPPSEELPPPLCLT